LSIVFVTGLVLVTDVNDGVGLTCNKEAYYCGLEIAIKLLIFYVFCSTSIMWLSSYY